MDTREIAEALVANHPHFYREGDVCPLCGYDGVWACDSKEESIQFVQKQLDEAISAYGKE